MKTPALLSRGDEKVGAGPSGLRLVHRWRLAWWNIGSPACPQCTQFRAPWGPLHVRSCGFAGGRKGEAVEKFGYKGLR